MAKIKKKYKPGQLLTINCKIYRVKRAKRYQIPCLICNANSICTHDGYNTIALVCLNAPGDCYLQPVIPKSSLG